ncbi:copper resistance protein NlpE [Capnocytophaga cynodegmi]|uniref:Putative lipoprotein n=1 Tax=Capnocytophaga cynodegmi TaxID=28189 RepID=A0A0B7H848_9FLAO
MKKIILAATSFAFLVACNTTPKKSDNTLTETPLSQEEMIQKDSHNAENSLDWAGTYKGIIPAASSPGIEVTLTLMDNHTYKKTEIYLEEKDGIFNEEGTFTWSEDGFKITLNTKDGNKQSYKVVEGSIIMLDTKGNEITSELASHYVLKKMDE